MAMYRTGVPGELAASSDADRVLAALAHGGLFYGMPFLAPLLVFLVATFGMTSAYVQRQAAQAMLFHLVYTVVGAIFFCVLAVALFGSILATGLAEQLTRWLYMAWPVTLAIGVATGVFSVWGIVIMAIATIKAIAGAPYRMPLVGWAWER